MSKNLSRAQLINKLFLNFRFLILSGFVLFFILFSAGKSFSANTDSLDSLRNEIRQRAKPFHLVQDDSFKILPRLAMAEREEKKGRTDLAREILDSCLFDLSLLESQNAMEKPSNHWKQARLEMLFDLLRGYTLISILALLIVKLPWFRKRREKNFQATRWGAAFLLAFAAIIFGWADISRFGEAAWSYFDIQIVITACAGLLGGWLPGMLVGFILTGMRLLIQPNWGLTSLTLLSAGFLGGIFFLFDKHLKIKLWLLLLSGMLIGFTHSLITYFPLRHSMPLPYLTSASLFVAVSETFGIFLFFAVINGLLREEKQEAVKHELVRSQLLFLQAQIKPHFLFNALNTIAAVCGSENAQKSKVLIGHLADFFRHALETSEPVLSLEKELEFVDAYLELEKARFGDEIKIIRNIHLGEVAKKIRIPILIIQPVVENAIRHGLRKKLGQGTLTITAGEKDSFVEVCVSDDGAGNTPNFFENYLKRNIGKAEGHGIGVRNIDERLRRFFGKGEWLSFETILGQGTTVTVRIPK